MKKNIRSTLFIILLPMLLMFGGIQVNPRLAVAQQVKTADKDSNNLSGINWDEDDKTATTDVKKTEPLSSVNWDDDTSQQEASGDSAIARGGWDDDDTTSDVTSSQGVDGQLTTKQLEIQAHKEMWIHITGFILFFGYVVGGIFTAYLTRDRKVAMQYPPELLILLHSVWPLELLLFPIIGKKMK